MNNDRISMLIKHITPNQKNAISHLLSWVKIDEPYFIESTSKDKLGKAEEQILFSEIINKFFHDDKWVWSSFLIKKLFESLDFYYDNQSPESFIQAVFNEAKFLGSPKESNVLNFVDDLMIQIMSRYRNNLDWKFEWIPEECTGPQAYLALRLSALDKSNQMEKILPKITLDYEAFANQ